MATKDDELPAWLKKLLDAKPEARTALGLDDKDLEDARGGYLRQDDYTKKTQEVAELRKIMEDNPGINAREAFTELKQLKGWVTTEWPQWQRNFTNLQEQVKTRPQAQSGNGGGAEHRWQGATVEDLYETERLQRVFGNLIHETDQRIEAAITKHRDEWYRKEELPRMDKVAQGYMQTLINLMKVGWPSDKPDLDTLLREAAAQQNTDFSALATALTSTRSKSREDIEAEVRAKIEQENKDRAAANPGAPASGPTGPLGGGTPTWKAPEKATPKTRDERFAEVHKIVSTKAGAPLPL